MRILEGLHSLLPARRSKRGTCYLEHGVWVMCDVGYLYANFSLPRPVCSRCTRQTDVRRASSLNAPYPMGWDIITDEHNCRQPVLRQHSLQ